MSKRISRRVTAVVLASAIIFIKFNPASNAGARCRSDSKRSMEQ